MKSKKILIIDDDSSLREMCRLQLEQIGFSVMESDSVEDGLTKMVERNLDLVILDLCMTNEPFDGTSFLALAKKMKQLDFIVPPIIVMSALTDKNVVNYVLDMGAKGYLRKPYNVEVLDQMVSDYIS